MGRALTRRGVIAFVASNEGPSRRAITSGHGAFAQAILDSTDPRGRSRTWVDPDRPMTLDDFRDVVLGRVSELTGRKQFAACYLPVTVSPRVPLFEPNRPEALSSK